MSSDKKGEEQRLTALEAIESDPRLRWKVEAWLKARERRLYLARVSRAFEGYWNRVRRDRLDECLVEAVAAVRVLERLKQETGARELSAASRLPLPAPKAPPPGVSANEALPPRVVPAIPERRRDPGRLQRHLPVVLIMPGVRGEPVREEAVTENISREGAAVYSDLSVELGRHLHVINKRQSRPLLAAVRGRSLTAHGETRLHLQFITQNWAAEDLQ